LEWSMKLPKPTHNGMTSDNRHDFVLLCFVF